MNQAHRRTKNAVLSSERPRSIAPRSIYLAGKIDKNDWRATIVDDLRSYPTFDGDSWPEVVRASIFGRHHYVGPFFTSCDHGCMHGRSTHGVGAFSPSARGQKREPCQPGQPRAAVLTGCLEAILRCDLVFAWIEDLSAYGTYAELGYARASGTTIWIAGPERLPDLWLVYEMANRTLFGVTEPAIALRSLLGEGT